MADLLDTLLLPSVQDRFWAKVSRSGACWTWIGARAGTTGYGAFRWKSYHSIGAHRASWIIANRKLIPAGQVVRHRCDNPPCVNPAHLVLGSQADNAIDAITRGNTFGVTGDNLEKETCPNGHPYDSYQSVRGRQGYRFCRQCKNETNRRYRERQRRGG